LGVGRPSYPGFASVYLTWLSKILRCWTHNIEETGEIRAIIALPLEKIAPIKMTSTIEIAR
jgi:hypothetical protein